MGWLGVRLKQVFNAGTRAAGDEGVHSDVITVRNDTGWQGAGDVMHRKHTEVVCENLKKIRVGFWTPNEKDRFWSSQARGERAPDGGPLELGGQMNKTA